MAYYRNSNSCFCIINYVYSSSNVPFNSLRIFRDIEYLWDVLLMLLMYCSAIFYYVDNIGSSVVRTVIRMNPLYCIIENFRHVVLLGESIFTSSMEINMLIYSSVFSVVALIISVIVFKKNQDRFILYI